MNNINFENSYSKNRFLMESIERLFSSEEDALVLCIIHNLTNRDIEFNLEYDPETAKIITVICGKNEEPEISRLEEKIELSSEYKKYFWYEWELGIKYEKNRSIKRIVFVSKAKLKKEIVLRFMEESAGCLPSNGSIREYSTSDTEIRKFNTNDEDVCISTEESTDLIAIYKSEFLLKLLQNSKQEYELAEARFNTEYEQLSDAQKLLFKLRNEI